MVSLVFQPPSWLTQKQPASEKQARAADVLELATVKVQALQVWEMDGIWFGLIGWIFELRNFPIFTCFFFEKHQQKRCLGFLENWGGFYYCTTVLPLD